MNILQPWSIEESNSPLVAFAIHDGHSIRPSLQEFLALDEAGRLREEDPFTSEWTAVAETRIVVHSSRFEVDLNRPREKAVYRRPEDAWGLQVWNGDLPESEIAISLELYDRFYCQTHDLLNRIANRFERFVVFDLHTYNHRRGGPDAPPASEKDNPEVNVGTGSMDREMWAGVVDVFMDTLRNADFQRRHLDVRENVKFQGGQLSRWIHQQFPGQGCSLAIEFKKFFMDEWSGQPDLAQITAIREALAETTPAVLQALNAMEG